MIYPGTCISFHKEHISSFEDCWRGTRSGWLQRRGWGGERRKSHWARTCNYVLSFYKLKHCYRSQMFAPVSGKWIGSIIFMHFCVLIYQLFTPYVESLKWNCVNFFTMWINRQRWNVNQFLCSYLTALCWSLTCLFVMVDVYRSIKIYSFQPRSYI